MTHTVRARVQRFLFLTRNEKTLDYSLHRGLSSLGRHQACVGYHVGVEDAEGEAVEEFYGDEVPRVGDEGVQQHPHRETNHCQYKGLDASQLLYDKCCGVYTVGITYYTFCW